MSEKSRSWSENSDEDYQPSWEESDEEISENISESEGNYDDFDVEKFKEFC